MNTLMKSFSCRSDPYFLDVVRGKISGASGGSCFGCNCSISTETTLWDEGGIYAYPATAILMIVSSSSDNDAETGSGSRTLLINGLGEGYVSQTEVIALNGQAGRTTVKKWLRIFRLTILTGGTVDGSEGNVYIGTGALTQGVPAVVYAKSCNGCNRSQNGIFTVPADHTAYVLHTRYTVGAGKEAIFKAMVKPETGVWVVSGMFPVYQNSLVDEIVIPFKLLEKTDVEIRVSAQVSVGAQAGIRYVLFEN